MRAIMVSVDYSDLLALTLPYNRSNFDTVTIVTSSEDAKNVYPIAAKSDAHVLMTDLFYKGGAVFNKWSALEWALDQIGRTGWLAIMDADVLWPKSVSKRETENEIKWHASDMGGTLYQSKGMLCTPRRRMWNEWPKLPTCVRPEQQVIVDGFIPSEQDWTSFPLHPQQREWAGFTQIFHADDPILGQAPWHQVDWLHAGGSDSFFQAKWQEAQKVRPPFEVLHLGVAGTNWMGRATMLADGTIPPGSQEKQEAIKQLWTTRRQREAAIRSGQQLPGGVFGPEKLS